MQVPTHARTLHLPEARAGDDDDARGLHQPEGVELVGRRLLGLGLGQEAGRDGDLCRRVRGVGVGGGMWEDMCEKGHGMARHGMPGKGQGEGGRDRAALALALRAEPSRADDDDDYVPWGRSTWRRPRAAPTRPPAGRAPP